MTHELEGKIRELCDYMSHISEDAFCAGWMDGLEYVLWYAIKNGSAKYLWLDVTSENIDKLSELSQDVEGWIYFDDNTGETFIAIEQWLKKYSDNISRYESKIS